MNDFQINSPLPVTRQALINRGFIKVANYSLTSDKWEAFDFDIKPLGQKIRCIFDVNQNEPISIFIDDHKDESMAVIVNNMEDMERLICIWTADN